MTIHYESELYHYGVKGMKWGVRRSIYKTAEKAGRRFDSHPGTASDTIKDKVKSYITDDEYKSINTKYKKMIDLSKESMPYEQKLNEYAHKVGTKKFQEDMANNPDSKTWSNRVKEKTKEYYIYDYGFEKARQDNPEWAKKEKMADEAAGDYINECKKVTDRLIGNYGNKKIKSLKRYGSIELRDVVYGAVQKSTSNPILRKNK